MRILVKRDGALGDVFHTTPIVARLRAENPDAEIDISTAYGEVYRDNPHISHVGKRSQYGRVIDLNGAYEKKGYRGRVHAVDAYSEVAFGDHETSHEIIFKCKDLDLWKQQMDWSKAIAFHPAISWPQRTLPRDWWQQFADEMKVRGYTMVLIGTHQDHPIYSTVDTRSRLSLSEQVGAIAASRAFVCSAAGPSVMAYATQTPIVCLLTMTQPSGQLMMRNGVEGWGVKLIQASIECVGCEIRAEEPVTYFPCFRPEKDNKCTTLFDVQQVADETEKMIRNDS